MHSNIDLEGVIPFTLDDSGIHCIYKGVKLYSESYVNNLENKIREVIDDCKFCHDYTQKVHAMNGLINKDSWFSLYEHYIEVIDNREDGNIMSFKIKYCPMCGRRLE